MGCILRCLGLYSVTMCDELVFFYSHTEKPYGVLSNFYPSNIVYRKKVYPTSEHLFQALKFLYHGATSETKEYAELIRCQSTPNKARELAHQRIKTKGVWPWRLKMNEMIATAGSVAVMRDDWEKYRRRAMLKCLRLKFRQNPKLREILTGTGNALLVEHTTRDSWWGDGGGGGKNMLGRVLMRVRRELASERTK